jgi:hypothetical protein
MVHQLYLENTQAFVPKGSSSAGEHFFFCLLHKKILASNRLSEEIDTVTKKSFKFCILKDRALEQHDYESDVLRYWCKPHAFAL